MREAPFWFDHIIVAAFTLGLGINAWFKIQSFLRRVAAGEPDVRAKEYRNTILVQWAITSVALLGWILLAKRPLNRLGLWLGVDLQFWIGVILTGLLICIMLLQVRAVRRSEAFQQTVREQLRAFRPMMPQTPREFYFFVGVSVTAGICEEILYRGYLLFYLEHWLPLWLASSVAVVAFGLAHSYQYQVTKGPSGLIKTTIFGGIAMFLYLLTESLWCPILLHVVVDFQSGYLAYFVAVHPAPEDSDDAAPTEPGETPQPAEIADSPAAADTTE